MKFSFDALIVDGVLDSRMRLRQAASALPQFSHVSMANSLPSALSALGGEDNCDVILLRPSFGDKELQDFIRGCKNTKQGDGCALILVVSSRQSNAGSIATNYAGGVDGFLSEPYSVDTIQEIFEIAGRMKEKKMAARCRAAIAVLLEKATTLVDRAATDLFHDSNSGARRELVELSKSLRDLATSDLETYNALLIETFENVPVPATRPVGGYAGASERVRKKLAEEAEKEGETENKPEEKKPAPSRMVIRKRR